MTKEEAIVGASDNFISLPENQGLVRCWLGGGEVTNKLEVCCYPAD